MKNATYLILFLALTSVQCKKETAETDCSTVTYSATIKPIITNNCTLSGCHNAASVNGDFTSYAGLKPFIDNGKFKNAVLVTKAMPKGSTLTQTQLDQITCWVNAGTPEN